MLLYHPSCGYAGLRGSVLVAGGASSIPGNNGAGAPVSTPTVLSSAETSSPAMSSGIFWTPTGPLVTARQNFTMVLLANGNVLAAGGTSATNSPTSSGGPLASAELYSTSAGIWNATGSLKQGRDFFQMLLLPNGNVLAAGGMSTSGVLASAELFSLAAGSWSTTGSLTTARAAFQMVLLQDGTVLAAGGISSSGGVTGSVEVYNSTLGTWSATGSLITGRAYFQLVLLPDGTVLAAGGIVDNFADATSAEVYSPSTGKWARTNAPATPRAYFQMVLLPNGNVLAAAGASSAANTGVLASAEVYNYTAGTWSATGSLTTARKNFQMVVLPTGNILAAGGVNNMGGYLATAEVYNYTMGSWPAIGTLMTARSDFQMAIF